jgi:hypothetical protein
MGSFSSQLLLLTFYKHSVICATDGLTMKMTNLPDILPGSLAVDRRFECAYFLHRVDDSAPLKRRSTSTKLHDTTSQKVVIFIHAAMRT